MQKSPQGKSTAGDLQLKLLYDSEYAASYADIPVQQTTPDSKLREAPMRTGERHAFYDFSPIIERPRLTWPGGASVAVMVIPNVEHFELND